MKLRDRIGVDLGRSVSLEEGVDWALANNVKYIDAQLDITPNGLMDFDEARCKPIREKAPQGAPNPSMSTSSKSW